MEQQVLIVADDGYGGMYKIEKNEAMITLSAYYYDNTWNIGREILKYDSDNAKIIIPEGSSPDIWDYQALIYYVRSYTKDLDNLQIFERKEIEYV